MLHLECYLGCLTCTGPNNNDCVTCDTEKGYSYDEGRCPYDNCESGTYFRMEDHECRSCHPECLRCTGQLENHCSLCSENKLLRGGWCVLCSQLEGFLDNPDGSNDCLEICGDGLNKGVVECDDGNLANLDGCSSQCVVELGYACSGGSHTSPDSCFDILPPFIEESSITETNGLVTLLFSEKVLFMTLEPAASQLSLRIVGDAGSYKFRWSIPGQQFPADQFLISLTVQATLHGTEHLIIQFSESGEVLVTDEASNRLSTFQWSVPLNPFAYQTPEEIEVVNSTGDSISGFTILTFLINLLISLILSGSIEAMWNLLNILQIINLLPLLSLYFPPNIVRMFGYFAFANAQYPLFQNLFQQYIINPDNIKQESYSKRFEDMGYESTSILLNCGSQLFLSLVMIALYPIVLLFARVQAGCFKCCSFLRGIEQSYRFNMFLRGIIENYVELMINVLLNYRFLNFDTGEEAASSYTTLVMLVLLTGAPILVTSILVYSKPSRLESRKALRAYGTIYEALNVRNDCALMYYPLFLLRRALFAIILIYYVNYPFQQCLICIISSVLLLIWVIVVKPFSLKELNVLGILSESTLLLLFCLISLFLKQWPDTTAKLIGWGIIGLMSLTILFNIVLTIKTQLSVIRTTCKRKRAARISNKLITKRAEKIREFERKRTLLLSKKAQSIERLNTTQSIFFSEVATDN